jgi:hypothetical protein
MGRDVAGYPPDRVRTVLLDRVDLRGLPTVEQGRAAWVIPAFLPEDGARVLFPDEPIAAPPTVHATCAINWCSIVRQEPPWAERWVPDER